VIDSQTGLERARKLAETGHHAEVAEYLAGWRCDEIESSPELSLLYGTAQARSGHPAEGTQWVELALDLSRKQGDKETETRALNARGAIAFVSGQIDEAADYFTQALMAASRDGDHATIGRCSNNLGILNNLRGRHAEAIGSYKLAIAAFERVGLHRGVAECRHNLGIAYSEQGELDQALEVAKQATEAANTAGNLALSAMTLRGRAEIHVLQGELKTAQREIESALATHHELGDEVEEAEDLRIVAAILAAQDKTVESAKTLRDVISRASAQDRPQLVAEAKRDLAYVLRNMGQEGDAQAEARAAIVLFDGLGAEAEVRKLDSHEWGYPLASELKRSLEPLHEAQRLADSGQYAGLLEYLGTCSLESLERSPTLALLHGIGHARLGRLDEGQQWVVISLSRARAQGDRAVEVRALNVYGAIALERGGIDEATDFFTRAQSEAMREGELTTVGRCANNLGIIANMRGDYGRAIGSYTMATAAYERAGFDLGVAETQHNLGITYRDQGNWTQAIQAADRAVEQATKLGELGLKAQALAGRAEIRLASGDAPIARREVEQALKVHRELGEEVQERGRTRRRASRRRAVRTARSSGAGAEIG
jgi:tetratricopeptide (TPR) repeat protein